ncbi:hypothetical protein Dimus_005570 [Dionaea muscipula]
MVCVKHWHSTVLSVSFAAVDSNVGGRVSVIDGGGLVGEEGRVLPLAREALRPQPTYGLRQPSSASVEPVSVVEGEDEGARQADVELGRSYAHVVLADRRGTSGDRSYAHVEQEATTAHQQAAASMPPRPPAEPSLPLSPAYPHQNNQQTSHYTMRRRSYRVKEEGGSAKSPTTRSSLVMASSLSILTVASSGVPLTEPPNAALSATDTPSSTKGLSASVKSGIECLSKSTVASTMVKEPTPVLSHRRNPSETGDEHHERMDEVDKGDGGHTGKPKGDNSTPATTGALPRRTTRASSPWSTVDPPNPHHHRSPSANPHPSPDSRTSLTAGRDHLLPLEITSSVKAASAIDPVRTRNVPDPAGEEIQSASVKKPDPVKEPRRALPSNESVNAVWFSSKIKPGSSIKTLSATRPHPKIMISARLVIPHRGRLDGSERPATILHKRSCPARVSRSAPHQRTPITRRGRRSQPPNASLRK